MVLHQVAQRAGALVIAGSAPDPEILDCSYLNVVDEVAVPDGFEQRICEPQRHQVLDGLLAQVMVDSEDLGFIELLQDLGIELARRGQVVPERLLDHDPGADVLAVGESGRSELPGDHREELRCG